MVGWFQRRDEQHSCLRGHKEMGVKMVFSWTVSIVCTIYHYSRLGNLISLHAYIYVYVCFLFKQQSIFKSQWRRVVPSVVKQKPKYSPQ